MGTRYSPRFQVPDTFERGRAETVQCPVYRDGALVPPTQAGSTVSVYRRDGTVVVNAAAVTVTGSIAQYTVPSASLPSTLSYERGWRTEWSLIMPDGETHRFVNDGQLVRRRLYPVIADPDIIRRVKALDPANASVITSQANYQYAIDEVDVEVQNKLLEDNRRPWLIIGPTALRQTWLNGAIAIVFEDLASRNDVYRATADAWRERFEAAYREAKLSFDYDEDGTIDDVEERAPAKPSGVWLC